MSADDRPDPTRAEILVDGGEDGLARRFARELLCRGARVRAMLPAAAAEALLASAAAALAEPDLRRVVLSDGRIVLVDADDENSDAAIREAVEGGS
jgi:NAD(P)-dependent dehydrogenase (short-subunit alcohol dehydrogenase family)